MNRYERLVNNIINSSDNNIELSNDILESLLFNHIYIDKNKRYKAKVLKCPVEVLRKLDLSGISFNGVTFADYRFYLNMGIDVSDEFKNIGNNYVDLSGTNTNINLDMTFEALYFNCVVLKNCNFSDVNIVYDDSNIRKIIISNCDLSNTSFYVKCGKYVSIVNSNLSNCNLSDISIDASSYLGISDDEFSCCDQNFYGCDLSDTGIKIDLDFSLVSLVPEMMVGKWKGCFVKALDTKKKIKGKGK